MHKKIILLMAITLLIAAGLFAQTKFDPKLFTFEEHVDNEYIGDMTFQTDLDYFSNLFAFVMNKGSVLFF